MPVDPTPEGIKQYSEEDDGGPVVMLNMLRYKTVDLGQQSLPRATSVRTTADQSPGSQPRSAKIIARSCCA